MRTISAKLFLAAAFLLSAAIPTISFSNAPSAGEVLFVQGSASLTSDGVTRAATKDDAIKSGDSISTKNGSIAQLRFNDESMLTLLPGSELTINEFSYSQHGGDTNKSVYTLQKGGVKTITGKTNKKNYALKTPVATIGIRGTYYMIRLCSSECAGARTENSVASENGVRLYGKVLHGAVSVSNKAGVGTFPAGHSFGVWGSEQKVTALPNVPDEIFSESFHGDGGENEGNTGSESNSPDSETSDRETSPESTNEEALRDEQNNQESAENALGDESLSSKHTDSILSTSTTQSLSTTGDRISSEPDEDGLIIFTSPSSDVDAGANTGSGGGIDTGTGAGAGTTSLSPPVRASNGDIMILSISDIGIPSQTASIETYPDMVIDSGAANGNAYYISNVGTLDQNGQPVTIGNIPVRAVHYENAPSTDCNPCEISIAPNASQLLDHGGRDVDSSSTGQTMINWGRWNNGIRVTNNGSGTTSSQDLHYIRISNGSLFDMNNISNIQGQVSNPTNVVFEYADGTRPTDARGNVGPRPASSGGLNTITVDFINQRVVDARLNVSAGGKAYDVTKSTTQTPTLTEAFGPNAQGINLIGNCSGPACSAAGSSAEGNIKGVLVGPNAEGIAGRYVVREISDPQNAVTGVGVWTR